MVKMKALYLASYLEPLAIKHKRIVSLAEFGVLPHATVYAIAKFLYTDCIQKIDAPVKATEFERIGLCTTII